MDAAERVRILSREGFTKRVIAAIIGSDADEVAEAMIDAAHEPSLFGAGGLKWRSQFDPDLDYVTDDVVRYRGDAWIAVEDIPAPAPAPLDSVIVTSPSGLNGSGPALPVAKGDTEYNLSDDAVRFYLDIDQPGTVVVTAPVSPTQPFIYVGHPDGSVTGSYDTVTLDAAAGERWWLYVMPGFGNGDGNIVLHLAGTATLKVPHLPWDRMSTSPDET